MLQSFRQLLAIALIALPLLAQGQALQKSSPSRLAKPAKPQMHASQDRCGFLQANNFHTPEGKRWKEAFEKRIQEEMTRLQGQKRTETVFRVPIIVHVIHNGEEVGTGRNISAEQIYSQIEVLNEDFSASNADLSSVRSQFRELAADMKVQFAPALTDPEGNLLDEPGIRRINGNKSLWTFNEFESQMKQQTQYDPFRYMNIWVAALADDILGYAQFPATQAIAGLPPAEPTFSDGVVINFQNFGSINKVDTPQLQAGAPYNLGRTLTHELGHWLGLLHIWGDGDCSVDDFVADTPNQDGANFGCPSASKASCGSLDMWENYMDYSDDRCMGLFTSGQLARVEAVLAVDEMRKQVFNSDVPMLGITFFAPSQTRVCIGGSVTYTAVLDEGHTIKEWRFDGGQPAISTASQPTVAYNAAGIFGATLVLNTPDGELEVGRPNLVKVTNPQANNAQLPFAEGFEAGIPSAWANASGAWGTGKVGSQGSANAAYFNNYDGTYSGKRLALSTPLLDLRTKGNGLKITFDVAYAYYQDISGALYDSLALVATDICSGSQQRLWQSGGQELATAGASADAYFPKANKDWKTIEVFIQDVSNSDFLEISWVSISNFGNNLFIDNIRIEEVAGGTAGMQARRREVCAGQAISFLNTSRFFGNPASATWQWAFEGAVPNTSADAEPGNIKYNAPGSYDVTLTGTINGVSFTETLPDYIHVVTPTTASTVLNEAFEDAKFYQEQSRWFNKAIAGGGWVGYEDFASGFGQGKGAIAVDNYNYNYASDYPEVLSPMINLQGKANMEISFDYAYSGFITPDRSQTRYDGMEILYTLDCGETYQSIWFRTGEDLATTPATPFNFIPTGKEWKKVRIPLYNINPTLVAKGIQVLFRNVGNFGNVLWLDNVQLLPFASQPPIADFRIESYDIVSDTGMVFLNDPVKFVSKASNVPQFWSWSLASGTPSFSTEEGPTAYYTSLGLHSASLTVSSPFGTHTRAKTQYVKVVMPPVGFGKVIDHTSPGGEDGNGVSEGGFISGHNVYGDKAVAEYFTNPAPFTKLEEVSFGFSDAFDRAPSSDITINVWDVSSGAPNNIIASTTLPMSQAILSAQGQSRVTAKFSQPVDIAGDFFVGIALDYTEGDTVALRVDRVPATQNTAWSLLSSNTWEPFSSDANWGFPYALWIFPKLTATSVVQGLEQGQASRAIEIYPNPSQGQIFLQTSNGLRIQQYAITDMVGRTLQQGQWQPQQQELAIDGLPNGVYFIKLETSQGPALKKFVLQK